MNSSDVLFTYSPGTVIMVVSLFGSLTISDIFVCETPSTVGSLM